MFFFGLNAIIRVIFITIHQFLCFVFVGEVGEVRAEIRCIKRKAAPPYETKAWPFVPLDWRTYDGVAMANYSGHL